ncbi:7TM diverse intracellular signaling domain-containing protein [Pedobacter nyackensis]|uniref:histidine kinase n=1 Tax=Pedobacter nyackensis TaxID=475255 RepID=A0A1W2EJF1_9SPHI|nr:7TM diverse intracellular signaling domain-containing protein [Pedobacter nyackensis]SMD09861.1 Signal transduction histidine kinase [Pedobacter nyackensis]
MLRKLLLHVLLLFMCSAVQAQLNISSDGHQIDHETAKIQYLLTPNNDFSDAAFLNLQEDKWQNFTTTKTPDSHTPYSVWFKIPINSLLKYNNFSFIDIHNPHINFLKCWIVKDGKIIRKFNRTGDNLPFWTRPLPTTTFVYPISGALYKDADFIIATDKRYTKLDLPVHFYTEAQYLKESQSESMVTGLFIGVLFFALMFNFYLYISMRLNLYLWYSLYLLMIILYLGTSMGELFKYFYPEYPFLNDIVRSTVFALSFVPQVNFFNELMDLKVKMPKVYRFNYWLLIVFVTVLFVAVVTSAYGNFRVQGFWLQANRLVSPLVMLVILLEAVYCFYNRLKYSLFAVVSFFGIVVFMSIYVLHQVELIPRNNFTATAVYWGLLFEGMVMALALAWRFKSYKEDSERLYVENQLQQENIFKETAKYQQKEMQRMSSLLHDTVGANLGFLRLETDNMPLTEEGRAKIASAITQLGHEVRTMSHGFSPLILQGKGLYQCIAEMVQLILRNNQVDLQFEWLGKKEGMTIQNEILIYRMIQEILQNLLKHSKATSGFLQIIIEQGLISIYAEDNGVGLKDNTVSDGLGLKSLENLVELLKGSFNIDSAENKGFSISIEFNQANHEKV